MKWTAIFLSIVLLTCAIAAAQTTVPPIIVTTPPPPTSLPSVLVTAQRIGGGTIICRGTGCANVMEGLQTKSPLYYMNHDVPTPFEEIPIKQLDFCRDLKAAKPSNCSAANPPSSPGITPPASSPWQPNGCGTGGMGDWFQDKALEMLAGRAYSGNLDEPFAGVSFTNACNGHDQCWAMGYGKGGCDTDFGMNMQNACSQLQGSSADSCSGFASLYHGIVSTTNAASNAYSNSAAQRTCAIWASDMRENNCGQ